MTACATKIEARRNGDLRITYTPPRKFTFAPFSPVMSIRDGATELLSITTTATVNGSVFTVVDDSLVVTIMENDIATLVGAVPSTERVTLSYDIVLTDQSGLNNWMLGGAFIVLGINESDCNSDCGDVEISLDGQCVQVSIEGGNIGVGASISLAELNAAVQEAETAADEAQTAANEAEQAVANIPALIAGKLDTDGDNADPALLANIGAVGSVDLAAAGGSGLVGFQQSGAGAIIRSLQDKARERGLSIRDFDATAGTGGDDRSAIIAAITAADALGVPLDWLDRDYNISAAIVQTLTGTMVWQSSGATVTYTGAPDVNTAISIALPVGKDHVLTGSGLSFNGNGKCNRGWYFHQVAGDQTATFTAEGLGGRNIQMFVAAAQSSAAVVVQGGFSRVDLLRPYAAEVMMRTGAGVPGSRGASGILVTQVSTTSGAYPRHVEIDSPVVDRVYSEDPAYSMDMDGIGVFANPDVDGSLGPSTARVTNPVISGCWGRDIKTQVSHVVVDDPKSVRNAGPSGGINNFAYDFQSGSSLLIGGDYVIDGISCTESGGICRFSTSSAGSPMSSEWQGGNVRVINGAIVPVVAVHDPTTAPKRAVSKFIGQSVKGSIGSFIKVRTNGFDLDMVRCENVVVDKITDGLFLTGSRSGGSSPYRAVLSASGCVQLDAILAPMVKANVSGDAAQFLLSQDADCYGFTAAPAAFVSSSATATSGLQKVGVRYPEPLQAGTPAGILFTGTERDIALYLTADQEYTLPAHGYANAYSALIVMGKNSETQAMVSVGSGIASRWAGTGVNVNVTTSVDPGSGDLRVWRTGQQLVIKNGDTAARVVMVKLFG